MKKLQVLAELLKNKGTKFISINYVNKNEEHSICNVLIGPKLNKVYQNDLTKLNTIKYSGIKETARQELINSINKSLEVGIGNNPNYTCKDKFEHLDNNTKFHNQNDELYIQGFLINKRIIKKGVYKEVKSQAKTIAKKEITKELNLRMGKFRMYKITENQLLNIKLNGKIL